MAPINLPNGNEVSEIVLPDGSTASKVIGPDGSTVFSALPESSVSRTNDNNSFSDNSKQGLEISVSQDWPSIDGQISQNASNYTTAYIYDRSDGTLMGSKDISTLSPGDVFRVKDVNLNSGGEYNFVVDAGGNSFTAGFYDSPTLPITSSDGNLSIIDGGRSETGNNSSGLLNILAVGKLL